MLSNQGELPAHGILKSRGGGLVRGLFTTEGTRGRGQNDCDLAFKEKKGTKTL